MPIWPEYFAFIRRCRKTDARCGRLSAPRADRTAFEGLIWPFSLAVERWLKAHPRFHLHFTPTSASWLNMVERFFAEITRNRIRRGAFTSVAELKSAIMEYLDNHNADPKPFIWTKSAGQILEKGARAKQALERVTTLGCGAAARRSVLLGASEPVN